MKYPDPKTEQLAYNLWEQAGCPEGNPEQFWYDAERKYGRSIFNLPFDQCTDVVFTHLYTIALCRKGELSLEDREFLDSLSDVNHELVGMIQKDKYTHYSNPIDYSALVLFMYSKEIARLKKEERAEYINSMIETYRKLIQESYDRLVHVAYTVCE